MSDEDPSRIVTSMFLSLRGWFIKMPLENEETKVRESFFLGKTNRLEIRPFNPEIHRLKLQFRLTTEKVKSQVRITFTYNAIDLNK
jgi:hypothetical protein